jgi:hypothetical protein
VLVSNLVDRGFIGGVMVSVFALSLVDRGFTGGVMVSVLASSLVDRGFIGGVMVRRARLESGRSWVHRWCNG